VLAEKLIVPHLVKKFAASCDTQWFITNSHAPAIFMTQIDPAHVPSSHFLKA
jgi:hypothetical protein